MDHYVIWGIPVGGEKEAPLIKMNKSRQLITCKTEALRALNTASRNMRAKQCRIEIIKEDLADENI